MVLRTSEGREDARASRILVVDDDMAAREALALRLVAAGYEVITASDGALALEKLEGAAPDLVISDLTMPALSGVDVIKAGPGAGDFLTTPIVFDQLLSRIRRQLSRAYRRRLLAQDDSHDALTRVVNRRCITQVLEHELRTMTERENLAVLIIDIDGFQAINDTYGYLAGDLALWSLARKLEEAARETDLVSRLGGDEFLIVAPALEEAGLATVIERLPARIPAAVGGSNTVSLSLSVGHASALPGDTVEELLERARMAPYAAERARKAQG